MGSNPVRVTNLKIKRLFSRFFMREKKITEVTLMLYFTTYGFSLVPSPVDSIRVFDFKETTGRTP